MAHKAPGLLGQLSPREREIFRLVAQGFTNQQIADQLGISIKSVETYRARVMEKLGLRSRADLVQFALSCGVLTSGNPLL
ncbi:MAG: helix-turn-helix transcriptional regulator [Nitrospirales bacterium]|nr:helix-turn-helix transcriptional regulator [Nitrospirales bacterium]